MNKKIILPVLLIAIIALIAGCVDNNRQVQPTVQTETPQTTDRPVPAGINIPIPITANYIAVNVVPNNYTFNSTAVAITGTGMINATNESKITTVRTNSMLAITFSGQINSGGVTYADAVVDNVPWGNVVLTSNGGLFNATSVTWVNGSIGAGTHNVWVQANTSAGTLNLLNTTLLVVAYPR